ncbi:MAG: M15 family metallopeptidase [Candidatus Competibacteraceae bacterium]|nr:M15 family metallopeptidase [Candidatus Competibacteraceae bacterium]
MKNRNLIAFFSIIFSLILFWGLFYLLGHYLSYQNWFSLYGKAHQSFDIKHNLQRPTANRFLNFVYSPLEAHMRRYGMISLEDSVAGIFVDLKYSSIDNFAETDMYGTLNKAMAHPLLASRLRRARALLKIRRPDLEFIVFDVARPKSIQFKLWEKLKDHPDRKKYVSSPDNGSYHNLGLAIDLSLADTSGNLIDMGCRYDYFGEEAHITYEELLVKKTLIKEHALENRRLLREIMVISGFKTLSSEWWHFYLNEKGSLPTLTIIP